MPDGGVTEAAAADAILTAGAEEVATTAATTAAADAAAGEGLGMAGELVAGEVAAEATGSLASEEASLAAGTGASEIAGSGPASIATEGAKESETQILAQKILGADAPPAVVPDPSTATVDGFNSTAQAAQGGTETAGKGIVDKALSFSNKYPIAALGATQTIAGAVGGVGKAALEKEMQERNIKARRDLLSQQSAEQLAQSRAGTLPGGGVNVRPQPNVTLRRPDGTPYFTNGGIINRAVQGG